MQKEMDAFEKNQTWDIVLCPSHFKPIGCKWIYSMKLEYDVSLDRCKA